MIKNGYKILTHCNAGALATVDYGTALSPMRFAHYDGKKIFVEDKYVRKLTEEKKKKIKEFYEKFK